MNSLHKQITLVLFLFIGASSVFAQGKPTQKANRERVAQLKIAYFTQELALTTEQAEKFWPVYNEMNEKIKEKKKIAKQASVALRNGADTLTEEEFKIKTLKVLDATIEEAKLRKEYHEKIAVVIGYKKAAKLLSLENQFKRELLKRLSESEAPKPKETDE